MGKEYDTVIFLNVMETDYTFEYSNTESLSKLFVGLSRARQNLHVFENLFNDSVGSLRWITDNEDLFDLVPDWNSASRPKLYDGFNGTPTRKCTDFVRSLNPIQRETLLNHYNKEELIDSEIGIGSHFGNPMLFGMLIEILLSIKLRNKPPKFTFKIYITSDEWKSIKQNKALHWLDSKINMIYGVPVKKILSKNSLRIIDDEGKLISEITNQDIVSSLIHKEYYNYLPKAQALSSQLTTFFDDDNINNIWWIVRFSRLTQLSLIGFNKPDLKPNDIQKIIEYISNSTILNNLNITEYHRHVSGELQVLSSDKPNIVIGELDFESKNAIIEIKCYSNKRSLEDAWLQTIIYNLLVHISNLRDSTLHKIASNRNLISNGIIMNDSSYDFSSKHFYKTLYIYNPISGQLWRRTLKNIK